MTGASGRRLPRSVVLVGLMGAGKSAIGRRLAQRLAMPFIDADQEIESAAGRTIEDIFAEYGEPAFRDVERRVVTRLLHEPPHVLATGGGAFMDEGIRALIAERGLSVWLRADLEVLLARTARRNNRPLLKGQDPREVLIRLIEQRYPIYALADLTVDSRDAPVEETVDHVMRAVEAHLEAQDRRW